MLIALCSARARHQPQATGVVDTTRTGYVVALAPRPFERCKDDDTMFVDWMLNVYQSNRAPVARLNRSEPVRLDQSSGNAHIT